MGPQAPRIAPWAPWTLPGKPLSRPGRPDPPGAASGPGDSSRGTWELGPASGPGLGTWRPRPGWGQPIRLGRCSADRGLARSRGRPGWVRTTRSAWGLPRQRPGCPGSDPRGLRGHQRAPGGATSIFTFFLKKPTRNLSWGRSASDSETNDYFTAKINDF